MMTAKSTFDLAIERSDHFLTIYDLLKNQRKRSARSDWSKKFKKFMSWPMKNPIMRVDGKDSMLVLRSPKKGLTYDRFEHDYVSEMLRSAIVAAVSALDRYMHDLTVDRGWTLLSGSEKNIPKSLRDLCIPVLVTTKAMGALRKNIKSRPGSQVKKAMQDVLHKSTFQGSSGIDESLGMLGVKDFWRNLAEEMPGNWDAKKLKKRLNGIVKRRNQIVHEADLERKISAKKDTLRAIKRKESNDTVQWIIDFVAAVERIV